MTTPLPLPVSLSSLAPEELSACFRAHLERSVFRDSYATPDQIRLADALADEERRALEKLIAEVCELCHRSVSHAEQESFLQSRARWLSKEDRSRLLGAAAFMMR